MESTLTFKIGALICGLLFLLLLEHKQFQGIIVVCRACLVFFFLRSTSCQFNPVDWYIWVFALISHDSLISTIIQFQKISSTHDAE